MCKCGVIEIISTRAVNHSFSASRFNLKNNHDCMLCSNYCYHCEFRYQSSFVFVGKTNTVQFAFQ